MRGAFTGCVVALLLAALPLSAAAELKVVLHKRGCECTGADARRALEEEHKVDYRWLGPERLEVQVWGKDDYDPYIDESSAWVKRKRNRLELGYIPGKLVPKASDPILGCRVTVRLTYVVSGLPRGRYSLQVEKVGSVQVKP